MYEVTILSHPLFSHPFLQVLRIWIIMHPTPTYFDFICNLQALGVKMTEIRNVCKKVEAYISLKQNLMRNERAKSSQSLQKHN